MARIKLAVDVGGTFTDFTLMDDRGVATTGKRLTTPSDPVDAIVDGTQQLADDAGVSTSAISQIIHGTTLVTNALIERKGVPTGLLTTRGFRDILETRAEFRYDVYDLGIRNPPPLVPRRFRLTVQERVAADGSVLEAVNEDDVRRAAEFLLAHGISSVAVSFLNSYANPINERRVAELLESNFPELDVTLSSTVWPEVREYERISTAAANAYVRPLARTYLLGMKSRLREIEVPGELSVVLSNGGLSTVETAADSPIRMLESGPAAGALAAAYFGKQVGESNVVSFDMGGTTAKMCLIEGGEPTQVYTFEVARLARFKKGSGLAIRVPTIELIEIGAGGGSIARVDVAGLLKVGPDSAGADPGPACYGRGGTAPTVTDADVLLGYLDPDRFLGGRMTLDRDAAEAAVIRHVAEPLGIDVQSAARGIADVVDNNMATATRLYAAEQGHDLRSYSMVAFGGAGPVHANRLAQILGINRIIYPMGAGIASALGMLVAKPSVDLVRSYVAGIDELEWVHVRSLLAEMQSDGTAVLVSAGVDPSDVTTTVRVDMRYRGQASEVTVDAGNEIMTASAPPAELRGLFEDAYRRVFGRLLPGLPIEAVNWRLAATAPAPAHAPAIDVRVEGSATRGTRSVHFAEVGGPVECPVYNRYALHPGDEIEGPALVEERETTIVIGPGAQCFVDPTLSLVVNRQTGPMS